MISRFALAAVLVLIPANARAYSCEADPAYVPQRHPVEYVAPTLLVGWTFDRSASSFIGFELSYAYRHRATYGGYAHALLLHDPDAGGRTLQVGIGALAGPWKSRLLGACDEPSILVPTPPVARLGYAWRAGNLEAEATSFAQVGVTANAVLGAMFSFAVPLQGGRSHGMQPSLALSLSLPIAVGHGY